MTQDSTNRVLLKKHLLRKVVINIFLLETLDSSFLLWDGSLITFVEGMEDILIYLMGFSFSSQIYVKTLVPTLGLEET